MIIKNPLEANVTGTIYFAENLEVLRALPAASVDLIYIDPPFNTGKVQKRTQLKTRRSPEGGSRRIPGPPLREHRRGDHALQRPF